MELRPLLGGGAAALGAAVGVAGSFDLAAAEALCAGGPLTREDILPTLIALVDKSVVLRTEEDAARYWLLDTIREFGAERLARLPADADATQDQHIAYFRAMAGEFSRHAKDDDQLQRYHLLRREHPDLRAALGYALDRPGRAAEAVRLAADLRAYWEISGLLGEGKHWLTKILLRFPGSSPERAWLLMTRGVLGTLQGELGEAVADLELSTPMAHEHGEVLACALGHAYLCLALVFSGRHAEAAAAGAVAAERLQAIDHLTGWCPWTSTWATCTCSAGSWTRPSSGATRGCAAWATARSGGPAATFRSSPPWPCSSRPSTPRARPRPAPRW
jgi:non-specific serine/threonine protein kinase